jgi:hypothetical protein
MGRLGKLAFAELDEIAAADVQVLEEAGPRLVEQPSVKSRKLEV